MTAVIFGVPVQGGARGAVLDRYPSVTAEMFSTSPSPAMTNISSVIGSDCPLKDAISRRISKLTVKVRKAGSHSVLLTCKEQQRFCLPCSYSFRDGSPRGTMISVEHDSVSHVS